MTDALTRLANAVEAGTASTMGFEDAGFDGWAELAYFGSLDAAKALHEAVLPEWGVTSFCQLWDVTPSGEYIGIGSDWSIELHQSNGDVRSCEACATADGPARAWLLAILRALAQVQK